MQSFPGYFEQLGFKYFGPVDGHNIKDLIEVLTYSKFIDGPVLIHAITKARVIEMPKTTLINFMVSVLLIQQRESAE